MSVTRPFLMAGATVPTLVLSILLGVLAACSAPPSEAPADGDTASDAIAESAPLVIYSGRNKSLIEPLLERYSGAVEVRYGGTAELAATLLEEGDATPCDVFIGQDAAALGALAKAGLFKALPQDVLGRVPARFTSPSGEWVGLSGRARTVVYNPERVQPEDLPTTLDGVTDPRWKGRWGLAPVNASFQAHMAIYGAVRGAEALNTLLAGMVANEPGRYPKNSAIVEAVIRGEIDWGLVNHYYLWRALKETPDAPGKNFLMTGDDVSSFLNLAGAGVLSDRPEAVELMRFLVSDDAQRYFAEETFEYPLVEGIAPSVELLPMAEQSGGQLDFAQVSDVLEPTLEAIAASGLITQ